MESNVALLQAASRLERYMGGSTKDHIKDSNVAQISAALYYQANVIAKLSNSNAFKETFRKTIYAQILEDFGNYIDAKARMNPRSLHHVYEWNKVGQKAARLFSLTRKDSNGISFSITYSFKVSKSFVPNSKGKRRHVFKNKASIIENGQPLVIKPRYSERLVFEYMGDTVFMPKGKEVVIKRPGGKAATNQFRLAYGQFFGGNLVSQSIKRSGFQRIFTSASARALNIPVGIRKVQYSFSPNAIRSQADTAVASAFGGALI